MRNDLTDLTDPTDDTLSPNGRNVVRLTDEVRFNQNKITHNFTFVFLSLSSSIHSAESMCSSQSSFLPRTILCIQQCDGGICPCSTPINVAPYLMLRGKELTSIVNTEEVLKIYKELYELRVTVFGEQNAKYITAGRNYAIELYNANRGDEAWELLTKMCAMSKQNYGTDHNYTKDVESTLKWVVSKINVVNQG